ncbi:MAG: hypothetical protein ACJAT2_001777 [Bacteriovoracaceae bacterium]|jgi:hypothetical protein
MESLFENTELINSKKILLNSIVQNKTKKNASLIVSYLFHGIKINFYSADEEFSLKVLNFLPEKWIVSKSLEAKDNLDIYIENTWNNEWDYEVNPDCLIERCKIFESAIQRDFLGIDYGDHAFISLTDLHADGIFNALRWLLPRRMLSMDTFLLHSSCVVDNGKAYFFLGHSGAGKSTVASLSGDRIVLGDDMNVMRFDGEKAFAKSGGLGGLSFTNTDYENEFEVAGFYWLKQSSKSDRKKLSASNGATKILASLANIFWENMVDKRRGELLDLSLEIASKTNFYQLEFKKDEEFWNHVTEE